MKKALFFLFILLLASAAMAAQPPPINSYASAGTSSLATVGDAYCVRGSATATVNITAFNVSAIAGGGSAETISLVRRSSADVGAGTPVVASVYDPTSPPATATATVYNTAPTAGALVGTIRSDILMVGNQSGSPAFITHRFQWDYNHPLILRGTSDFLCLNFSSPVGNNAQIVISHEHTEFPLP